MKTIFRIFVILAASMLVIGVTAALGQNSSTTQFRPRTEEFRPQTGDSATSSAEVSRSEGRREFEGGRRTGGFNIFGILGFAQTLVPIAIVIGVVTAFNRFGKLRKTTHEAEHNIK